MSKKIFFFGTWNPKINSKPNYEGFCVEINTIKFGLVFHEEFSDRILKEHPKLYSEIDTIYNKWLNIFPFELPIFESLKDSFTHKGIPFRLVKESNEITLFNPNNLIKVLFEISNDFFQQINAETLYGSSMIYDIDKHKVKLILQAKKQRNKLQYPKKENDFSIMIDEWLKDEQETWEQLTPYFYKKPHQTEENNTIKTPSPQQTEKLKPEQETPKTFDELFYNIELVQPSIDILKEIEPPLIDTDCNFIGKLKGIICVWIDELQRQGIVKHYSDRKIFASLIPQKIKRFSIDESMFGKYQSKAENNYRTDIKTKVSKIKLSQNSH